MGSIQMMLVMGAFLILGLISNTMRDTVFQGQDILESNTHSQEAITIARSILDEIQQKPFDAVCTWKKVVQLTDLTSCGHGYNEAYPNFNDLDDWHGAVFQSPAPGTASATPIPPALLGTEGYTVSCDVRYVIPDHPHQTAYSRTWSKHVTITVTNAFSKDDLSMSYIASY